MQQLVEFCGKVQQFQLAALVRHGRVRADQFADSGRIDGGHTGEIEQDLVAGGAGDHIAKLLVARADRDLAINLDDGDAVYVASGGFHLSSPLSASPRQPADAEDIRLCCWRYRFLWPGFSSSPKKSRRPPRTS